MNQDVWNREDGHLVQGARMAAAAVVSAVLTAAVVIVVGQVVIDRHAHAASRPAVETILVRTAG